VSAADPQPPPSDLLELARLLPEVYNADGCVIWLLAPHKMLDGRSAAEVWLAGDHARVLAIVDTLRSGAFA
jgi:hypothetical protein